MKRIFLAGVAVADFVFNVDTMPDKAVKYRAQNAFISGGGNAANSAVATKRLGGEVMLAARVGADSIGDFIVADLKQEELDTSLVHRVEGGVSSFSSVYLDRDGERQIVNFEGRNLGNNAEWLNDVSEFDALLTDNHCPPLTRKAIEIANSRNVPVVVDAETPFDADVVRHATYVAFSFQGIRNFTGIEEAGSALVAASEKLGTWVSFTDGKNGTYFLENGVPVNIPAVAVEVVDTLGAGDVWHAAFTLTLAEGLAPRRAIIFANAAATIKCTRSGGRMDWPARAEVERFLDLHKLAI